MTIHKIAHILIYVSISPRLWIMILTVIALSIFSLESANECMLVTGAVMEQDSRPIRSEMLQSHSSQIILYASETIRLDDDIVESPSTWRIEAINRSDKDVHIVRRIFPFDGKFKLQAEPGYNVVVLEQVNLICTPGESKDIQLCEMIARRSKVMFTVVRDDFDDLTEE